MWDFLHAETDAEAEAILKSAAGQEDDRPTPTQIDELKALRASLGPKPQEE